MSSQPSVLIVTTQIWLQITRLAMRLSSYGCRLSVLCPEESHLTYAPGVGRRFSYRLGHRVHALRHAIETSGAEYILPTDDLSVLTLHELADTAPSLRPLIERSIGSSEYYPILRSRFKLLSLAHTLGIAVPRTDLIRDHDDLHPWCTIPGTDGFAAGEGEIDRAMRPFVLKKDGTWGGTGVQVAHSPSEAHDAYCHFTNKTTIASRLLHYMRSGDSAIFARHRHFGAPEITAQQYVQGVPANSMYVCDKGRVLAEVQARVVASKGKTGPSLVIQLIDDPRIARAGRLLAEALKISGCFGLDFMLDARTGEPLLIELNPRSTQLGHVAVAGSCDLAGYLWSLWTGQAEPKPSEDDLGRSICFYPEGEQWTQKTASFPGCRTDVLDEEKSMLAAIAAGDLRMRVGLRRRFWMSIVRLKGSLKNDTQQQAFYYQDMSAREVEPLEREQELVGASAGPAKPVLHSAKAIRFAS